MLTPITINGRFLTRASTGVERFAAELLREWLPNHGRARSATLAIPPAHDGLRAVGDELGVRVEGGGDGRLQGQLWEQLRLPGMSEGSVLVNLCNSAPVACRRQVVVLHDAAVAAMPGSYGFAYRSWHRLLIAQLLRRSALVATVSHFSAAEIRRWYGSKTPIEVIPEGGEHVLRERADRQVLERLGLTGQRFVLTVGSRSPTKNLQAVAKAASLFADLGVTVVAAGGANRRVFRGGAADPNGILMPGYVTDAELRALYEAAECFVFPSLYEGFGLPPLEAMHCGCPVIVSRRASMPEVCGEAALYFDPQDPAEIAAQVRRVLSSAALRAEMREAGQLRARRFSWALAAERFEQVFADRFRDCA